MEFFSKTVNNINKLNVKTKIAIIVVIISMAVGIFYLSKSNFGFGFGAPAPTPTWAALTSMATPWCDGWEGIIDSSGVNLSTTLNTRQIAVFNAYMASNSNISTFMSDDGQVTPEQPVSLLGVLGTMSAIPGGATTISYNQALKVAPGPQAGLTPTTKDLERQALLLAVLTQYHWLYRPPCLGNIASGITPGACTGIYTGLWYELYNSYPIGMLSSSPIVFDGPTKHAIWTTFLQRENVIGNRLDSANDQYFAKN